MGSSIGPAAFIAGVVMWASMAALIGPGFESEEPAGLLAVSEQRNGLAAEPLPDARDEIDQEVAPSFRLFGGRCSRSLVR